LPLKLANATTLRSVQCNIIVAALSDVPDQDPVTVVVVGGLSPRTGAGNVASAYVEPLTLGVPGRYVSHDPLLYRKGGDLGINPHPPDDLQFWASG
jgi:hypothetical protein